MMRMRILIMTIPHYFKTNERKSGVSETLFKSGNEKTKISNRKFGRKI